MPSPALITTLISIAFVVVAGVGLASQAPINAALARAVGDGVFAAFVSFAVGTAVLAVVTTLKGGWPSSPFAQAPWWVWVGGFLGAYYVAIVIWVVPKLGVVTVAASVIFGQMLASLAIDTAGAFGLPPQPLSWQRALAVLLVAAGVVLSRLR